MLRIKEYVKAESLEQAYELNQKRSNRILGGMLWMKMSSGQVQTAIDLSGLGLDQIEETEEEFRIGCMVTLRELECHEGLERYSCGAVGESVCHIVGVQFRNLATLGGSLYGRFGFSDVLTCFMALDAQVELYKGGIISLREFAKRERDRDILVRVIVKKRPGRYAYLSQRNTRTDFPVLTVAVGADDRGVGVAVGARPGRAIWVQAPGEWEDRLARGDCQEEALSALAEELAGQIPTGSNMRASAEYRSHLARVMIRRGLTAVQEERR